MAAGPHDRTSTGVGGLDEVLHGGLVPGRSYLVRGVPGTGKTILGFAFLAEGHDAGETTLFINLEEPEHDVRANASSLGFDLDGVNCLDLSPTSEFFAEDQSYDIFAAGDVEQAPLTDRIVERVDELEPDRVFLDPVTQFRYLTADDYQFRKQMLSLMRFLKQENATVLFTSQRSATTPDDDLQFLSDGIIDLARSDDGRTLSVPKFRGSDRQAGTHSLRITGDGVAVYPELVPGDHEASFENDQLRSGVANLDQLLGGGIERATITVLSGPTGVGKTTTGTLFAQAAAARGERAVIYHFEETADTFRHRCRSIGMNVADLEDSGSLAIEEVEPVDLSPEQFAWMVRRQVEARDARFVMLDGIEGYKLSIRGKTDALVPKLHALGRYLKNMGVTMVIVDEIDSVTGEFQATNAGISYLTDNIVFLRHVEMNGTLQKVAGVLKKRAGPFERTLREFEITSDGVVVGEPVAGERTFLRGTARGREADTE